MPSSAVYFWHIFGSDNSNKNNTSHIISLQLWSAVLGVKKGIERETASKGRGSRESRGSRERSEGRRSRGSGVAAGRAGEK